MHLVDGLAAPCMVGGAWVGARCWLGGRGLVYLFDPVTSLLGGCYMKWLCSYLISRMLLHIDRLSGAQYCISRPAKGCSS